LENNIASSKFAGSVEDKPDWSERETQVRRKDEHSVGEMKEWRLEFICLVGIGIN
jgi:hypothetical protein